MSYSYEIAKVIKAHLDDQDMKLVGYDEEDGTFGFFMHIPAEICQTYYTIYVHDDSYTVLARCPIRPKQGDTAAMLALSEFVNRANHGLRNGNFEMDFDDGEIRYKSFVDCDDLIPSENVVRDSIAVAAAMLKRYAPGIIDVMYRGKDAKTAVKECEESNSMRHDLEELRRMLEERLKRMGTSHDDEDIVDSDDEDESDVEAADSEPEFAFPSLAEFLQAMDEDEDEDDT